MRLVREALTKKKCFLSLDVKNDVLAPITEPSNDDYDNDGRDKGSHPEPIVQFF